MQWVDGYKYFVGWLRNGIFFAALGKLNQISYAMTRQELEEEVKNARKRLDDAPGDTPHDVMDRWLKDYDYLVFQLDNLYDDQVNEFTD